MKKKFERGNPWLFSYLSLAMFCCVIISAVFLYINLENLKNKEHIYTEEKLTLVVEDLEKQLETYKEIGLKITISNYYAPFYFQRNKYYEKLLLDEFTKYLNYSPLVNEYFLYYKGEDILFHSNNATINLNSYLEKLMITDVEKSEILQLLTNPSEISIYPLNERILIFYPLSISVAKGYNATLCMVLEKDDLSERIQTVSGGLNGDMAVYANEIPLLDTSKQSIDIGKKDAIHIEGKNGNVSVYYMPEHAMYISTSFLPLHIMSVIAVIILVLFTASLFAWRSYRPIILLTQKFRPSIKTDEEAQFANALDEINYMMETIISNNTKTNALLEQKQVQLRNQLLILLLEGKYTFDIQPYLTQARLILPGTWYFVIIVLFKEDEVNAVDLEKLRELFEGCSNIAEERYVYAISNDEHKTLCCICSVSDRLQCEEIYEDIKDLSESYGNKPKIGQGNTYHSISHLSASYLEALDNVHKYTDIPRDNQLDDSTKLHNESALHRICNALSNDKEQLALEALEAYLNLLRKEPSVLMLQYHFSNFYYEISRIYREFHIEMPKQYISLSISTRNVAQFEVNAEKIIKVFFEQLNLQKERVINEEAYHIYKYVNEHFMDYEMSIESVAQEMNTNVASVRSAIKEHSGRSYKEYLIHLRMEYAKELLVKQNLTVAETCQRVGYGNISYFIKAFKTHTGVTPANYKNLRESNYE